MENCGVGCIRRYLKLTGNENESLIRELEDEVSEEGLSFKSIMDVMGKFGYEVLGYYSHKVFRETPYIMFDSKRKHYYLVEEFGRFTVRMYDPNLGIISIWRLLFRLFWCKYYLAICYNEGG